MAMNVFDYECEGQLSFADIDTSYMDKHYDRDERPHEVPKWMSYERCENCIRWHRYPKDEQPPCGWGIKGWCNEHSQKTGETGYCNSFEDKRRV